MDFKKRRQLVRAFQNALEDNTLRDYYSKTLGVFNTTEETAHAVNSLTYKYFCERPMVSYKMHTQMSAAAYALQHNSKIAFENKRIKKATYETSHRIAAIIEPDDPTIISNWQESAEHMGAAPLEKVVTSTLPVIRLLKIENTQFAEAIDEKLHIVEENRLKKSNIKPKR